MNLYERLGGEPAIHAAVENFYLRVLSDPFLEPFFSGIDLARLKKHQFSFLSQAFCGPKQYSGASMARAHQKLPIEQRHFDAVAGHLVDTLHALGVGEAEIAEVVAAVAPLAEQIVMKTRALSA